MAPSVQASLSQNSTRRSVAILIDTDDSWGRRVIGGISLAVRNTRPWDLLIAPRDTEGRLCVPEGWRGHGLITAIRDERMSRHVQQRHLPTVNVSTWGESLPWCTRVSTDERRRGELAFRHFYERGYRHFAYYSPPRQRYSELRGIQYQQVVREAGFDCFEFVPTGSSASWERLRKESLRWLKNLPRPLGIFAAKPQPALQLVEICRSEGISIPNDIAILAGDTDDLLCECSNPPLSSIVLASERIGRQAVELLDALIHKQAKVPSLTLIPPTRVAERESTDLLAIDDDLLAQAIRQIRQHYHQRINVGDILKAVPISRRVLEQKCLKLLNRTPAAELRHVRIEQVKRLLATTTLSIREIAEMSGFSTSSRMCVSFRDAIGTTPAQFRKDTLREPC